MAVYPKFIASSQSDHPAAAQVQPVDIDAWTEQATQPIHAVTLNPQEGVRGTSVSLAIDLDEYADRKAEALTDAAAPAYRPRREPVRRDSLNRREALLKGKEGSRRRVRWENGSYNLQNNKNRKEQ